MYNQQVFSNKLLKHYITNTTTANHEEPIMIKWPPEARLHASRQASYKLPGHVWLPDDVACANMGSIFLQKSKTSQIWILFISKLSTQVTKYNEHIYLHLDYEVWQHPRSQNVSWTHKTTNFVYNIGLENTEQKNPTRKDTRLPFTSGAFLDTWIFKWKNGKTNIVSPIWDISKMFYFQKFSLF